MSQAIHPVLERVARAIQIGVVAPAEAMEWELTSARRQQDYLNTARAAVQALLEPDEGMKRAGADELFGSVEEDWTVDARRVFRAMLLPLIGEGE